MSPSVSVVMLCSPGRDRMRARAIASVRSQTYSPIQIVTHESRPGVTIGTLRNEAVERCFGDIIAHADDDDVSHGLRIEEQVALLESSDADCVGYRECAFWDTRVCSSCKFGQPYLDEQQERPGRWHGTSLGPHRCDSTAWVYRSPDPRYAIGASLMYWRTAHERVPFPDKNVGEDQHFTMRVKTVGVSALTSRFMHGPVLRVGANSAEFVKPSGVEEEPCEPRLICGIHGSNSADYRKLSKQSWRRAPELDEVCRVRMAL